MDKVMVFLKLDFLVKCAITQELITGEIWMLDDHWGEFAGKMIPGVVRVQEAKCLKIGNNNTEK